ncbi:MAG: hypothetical protein ABIW83_09195 [Allosphingosinicella sp.]
MRETDLTPASEPRGPSRTEPTFRQMAREEFWFVAKAFFAPVYGTYLVWKQLLRVTDETDRKVRGVVKPQIPSQPAE